MHSIMRDVVREVTNDFCDCYKSKDDCRGFSAVLIPHCLPEGVDPRDARVQQVIAWCLEVQSEECEPPAEPPVET